MAPIFRLPCISTSSKTQPFCKSHPTAALQRDTPAIIKQLNFNFGAQFIKASYQTLRQLSWIKLPPWDTGNFSLVGLRREKQGERGKGERMQVLGRETYKKKPKRGKIKMHSFKN